MQKTVADIMTTEFHTLTPQTPVSQAVKLFKQAQDDEGRKIFGMMVVDDKGKLVGMLSLYDILLFIRPKHTSIWGKMEDIDFTGVIDSICEKINPILVGDIMTPEVITVAPQTHILMILDLMINKHIRRLPVLENNQIKGIIYITDLFYSFLDRFSK